MSLRDKLKNEAKDFISFESDEAVAIKDRLGFNFVHHVAGHTHTELLPGRLTDLSVMITKEACESVGMTIDEFYKLNSDHLRSDEFKTEHDGLHVVFAGCSNTFGDGMFYEMTWAHKAYMAISERVKTSGYFNIGVPGIDAFQILGQIVNYIKKYGIPDILFLNWPDTPRNPKLVKGGHYPDGRETEKSYESPNPYITTFYNAIAMLIKNNGGEVYSFSYDPAGNWFLDGEDYRRYIDDYYIFEQSEHDMHIYEYQDRHNSDKHIDKDFMYYALDDSHPGTAFQDFWYNFIIKKFFENTRKVS